MQGDDLGRPIRDGLRLRQAPRVLFESLGTEQLLADRHTIVPDGEAPCRVVGGKSHDTWR